MSNVENTDGLMQDLCLKCIAWNEYGLWPSILWNSENAEASLGELKNSI